MGCYRVIRQVHHGPLGTLFEARLTEIEDRISLKILDCDLDASVRAAGALSTRSAQSRSSTIPISFEHSIAAKSPVVLISRCRGSMVPISVPSSSGFAPERGIDLPTHVHAENRSGR